MAAKELSGRAWVAKFPGTKDLKDLEKDFKVLFTKFVTALEASGATKSVTSVLRPKERAYLMHWSWRIAKQAFDAATVPAMAGVDIEWNHGTAQPSRTGSQEMVDGYGTNDLEVAPSLTSRHTTGQAVDMAVSWAGTLKIKDASGKEHSITSTPRDHTNVDLIAVAKTFGVVHFQPVDKDRLHWSNDGK